MKSKFFLFLFLGIILNLSLRIYIHRSDYLTHYDSKYWHERYLKSQWVTTNSTESIGDDGLYAWAGWAYVHGSDPSLLNPEMPPLGKLIIGWSAVIFGNQNIQALLFGVGVLFLIYHLARLFLTKTLAMASVYLFSLEPIFANQINSSSLDLPELFFFILSVFFFLKFLQSTKSRPLFFSLLFLGAMMAVKFFIFAFILGLIYLAVLIFLKGKEILRFIFFTPTILAVYLLSYAGYFLNGHNFREFLSLQKWILVFYKDSLAFAFPGGPFWMMLFNRWESWFGGTWYRDHVIISAPDWQLSWPLVFLLTFFGFVLIIKGGKLKKNYLNQAKVTLFLWIGGYFLFLSLAPIFPRYLLLVLPLMYILSLDLIMNTNFLSRLLKLVKGEFRYKNDYFYLMAAFLVIAFWKIRPIFLGNFVFSPQLAHDFFLTRNVIFGLTSPLELGLLNGIKPLFLSLPYFLADGSPKSFSVFLIALPVVITIFTYYLLRTKNRKAALIAVFPIFSFFLFFYQIWWKIPIFASQNKEELLFKNEKEVMDFTYRDSEIYKFAILPLNRESAVDHYRFLYQWYDTRVYRGKNVAVGDNEMQILYVIIEPSYLSTDANKKSIASKYKVNFRFDQKLSSGIIAWKFDRLTNLETTVDSKK